MEIRTPRLILRTARPDDLEAMHAVLSDPRATVWWSTPPHETLDQTREWLDASIRLLQRLGFVRTGFGERTYVGTEGFVPPFPGRGAACCVPT